MVKVGLTGGLACGKSYVGAALESYGCLRIDADELGHAVLAPGGEAFEAVIREFGDDIVVAGRIDRLQLAARVFNDPQRLAMLNHLVHPPVIAREEQLIAGFTARQPHGIAIVEAAILIETGSYKRFDRLILVACSEQQQIGRAMHRGLNEESARARLARQMPLAEKRKFAHFVVDTSGSKDDTLRQTRAVYEELRKIEA
jgi:dephospho-CoA kinase